MSRHSGVLLVGLLLVALAGCEEEWKGFDGAATFGPYLQDVGTGSAVLGWRTATPGTSVVEYGPTEGLGHKVVVTAEVVQHKVKIAGLLPGARYHYKVRSESAGKVIFEAAGGPFRTALTRAQAIEEGEPVRFAALGEYHNADEVGTFTPLIEKLGADFVVDAADTVDSGDSLADWEETFRIGKGFFHRLPFYTVMSNHSYARSGGKGWHEIMAVPTKKNWYTFRWGQVQFFMLDSTYNKWGNGAVETEQLDWLDAELAKAADGEDDPVFKVAVYHYPTFSSGPRARWMDRLWGVTRLVPLFEKHGVELVIYAHDKFYERSLYKGVPYVQIATGKLAPKIENKNPYKVKLITDKRTMLFCEAKGHTLTYTAYTADGVAVDGGRIEK